MDEGKPRRPFGRRSPLRSFALGGLIGAAGTIATVRRLRRARPAAGLAAFEDAPCFLETMERAGAHLETGADAGGE